MGNDNKILLFRNCCSLHPIDVNSASQRIVENSAPDSHTHVEGINDLQCFELSCSVAG